MPDAEKVSKRRDVCARARERRVYAGCIAAIIYFVLRGGRRLPSPLLSLILSVGRFVAVPPAERHRFYDSTKIGRRSESPGVCSAFVVARARALTRKRRDERRRVERASDRGDVNADLEISVECVGRELSRVDEGPARPIFYHSIDFTIEKNHAAPLISVFAVCPDNLSTRG